VCRVALGYSIRTQSRFRNRETGRRQKQCEALDEGASDLKEVQYEDQREGERRTFKSEKGFVFDSATSDSSRELVNVPATKEQKDKGVNTTNINYHSLVVETGGNVMRHREFVIFHREYVYPEFVVVSSSSAHA
jgi:hypothetical protein